MKRVKGTVSRANHFICPLCAAGELKPRLHERMFRCNSCSCNCRGPIVKTLQQIVALPDALGKHPCECGHPEMRPLPESIFHCPACGSEVFTIG